MRRFCDPFCALHLVVVVLAFSSACEEGVQVSLQLKRAPGVDTASAQSLTITLASAAASDRIPIALDRDEQVQLPELEVDATVPFSIDVWACTSETACTEGDVVFRGCTDGVVDLSQEKGVVPLTIVMHRSDAAALAVCPAL